MSTVEIMRGTGIFIRAMIYVSLVFCQSSFLWFLCEYRHVGVTWSYELILYWISSFCFLSDSVSPVCLVVVAPFFF
jgi:hypothetical protein